MKKTSTTLKVTLAGATDAGRDRDHNEDAFALAPMQATGVVADGMGGLERGEVASQWVVAAVIEAIEQGRSAADGILQAHLRIREETEKKAGGRMGAAAVAFTIEGARATIHWIGDCRAYLWRAQTLKQLTRDHSFVNELVEAGAISAAEATHHPNRNVVTRAVGIHESATLKVDTVELELLAGDRLLLCSDGLHGYLPHGQISDSFADAQATAAQIAQRLIERTLRDTDAGDNVTVVCATVEG